MPSLHRSASLCHRCLLHSKPKEYFAMHMSRLHKTVKHFCGIQMSCFKFWVPWVWDGSQQVGNPQAHSFASAFQMGQMGCSSTDSGEESYSGKEKKVVKRKLLVKTNARNHRSYLY